MESVERSRILTSEPDLRRGGTSAERILPGRPPRGEPRRLEANLGSAEFAGQTSAGRTFTVGEPRLRRPQQGGPRGWQTSARLTFSGANLSGAELCGGANLSAANLAGRTSVRQQSEPRRGHLPGANLGGRTSAGQTSAAQTSAGRPWSSTNLEGANLTACSRVWNLRVERKAGRSHPIEPGDHACWMNPRSRSTISKWPNSFTCF